MNASSVRSATVCATSVELRPAPPRPRGRDQQVDEDDDGNGPLLCIVVREGAIGDREEVSRRRGALLSTLQRRGGPKWWHGEVSNGDRNLYVLASARPRRQMLLLAVQVGGFLDGAMVRERPVTASGLACLTKRGGAHIDEIVCTSIHAGYIEGGPAGRDVSDIVIEQAFSTLGGPVVFRPPAALRDDMTSSEVVREVPSGIVAARVRQLDGDLPVTTTLAWLVWSLGERTIEALLADGIADSDLTPTPTPQTPRDGRWQLGAATSADGMELRVTQLRVAIGPRPRLHRRGAFGARPRGMLALGEVELLLTVEGPVIGDHDEFDFSFGHVTATSSDVNLPLSVLASRALATVRWAAVGQNGAV